MHAKESRKKTTTTAQAGNNAINFRESYDNDAFIGVAKDSLQA